MPSHRVFNAGMAGPSRSAIMPVGIWARIAASAEANGYRINDFIVGVVMSDAFRMRRVADTQAAGTGQP